VRRVVFWYDGGYLLTDFDPAYGMGWHTTRLPDGTGTFEVRARTGDGLVSRVEVPVTLANGPAAAQPPAVAPFQARTGTLPEPGRRFRLVAVGDGVDGSTREEQVAAQIAASSPNLLAYLGDVYQRGSHSEFDTWYANPAGYGKFRDITNPVVGNHEYQTPGAAGYFGFWGGIPHHYSYDVAGWHVVVLNSECSKVGGCTRASPQGQWLAADLAAHPNICTLAITHKARFGSGPNGDHTTLTELWELLYEAGADVVLSGHDHNYERFDPQDPNGQADPARGIRQFIVGTGGNGLSNVGPPHANSVISNGDTYGVLKLTLRPNRYEWAFVPVAGRSFADYGSADCVGAPALPWGCGIGPELALLLPILGVLRRRRSTGRPAGAT
jgi:hypothetical protein